MNRSWLIALTNVAALIPAARAAEVPSGPGKVESVILYRGQALVTCSVPIDTAAGRVEFEVVDLPEQVVPSSLFAEGKDGIEVRAVRYRTFAVSEEPREEVRRLDEEIQELEDAQLKNTKEQQLIAMKWSSLDKLEAFTAPTAKAEMTKGVLHVETLKQLTLFMFAERKMAMEASFKLELEQRGLEERLLLAQKQRGELTSQGSRTARRALLFLEKRAAGKGEVKLSYLVNGAGWSPSYNFRATPDGKQVEIEYNALIQQMSGEDWNDVSLTLSTASPALSAQGPDIAPFRVALAKRSPQKRRDQNEISNEIRSLRGMQRLALDNQQKAQEITSNTTYNWDMNVAANGFQQLELTAGEDAVRMIQESPESSEGPSVSYKLPNLVSLAARSDQQMLRVSRFKLESKMYHVAMPILTSYVYREAELKNIGEEALLAGPVSVYLNNKFVGRGEISTVARGQTFVLGFGADPQLRVRRELVSKDDRIQGGNRIVSFKYKLMMENYMEIAVPVRLIDRIPVSDSADDIRVTLTGIDDGALSKDELYIQSEKPKGILRWDIEVPARASGAKANVTAYGYTLELDKALSITSPVKGKSVEMKQEFEMMRSRKMLR